MLQGRARLEFLRGLIGLPYVAGGDGPLEFDCYGLVRHVSRHLFDREMPSRDMASTSTLHRWRRIPNLAPQDGAIVLMHLAAERHVGIYLTEGGVLHAMEPGERHVAYRPPAVALDKLFTLGFYGFTRIRMYVPHDTVPRAREPHRSAA